MIPQSSKTMSETEKQTPSLKSQSVWLMSAKFIGYIFAFIFPLIVARVLTKSEVGTYQFIFRIIVNAAGMLPLGIGLSAYYYLSRSPEERPKTILNILLINFFAGGIAFVILFFFPDAIRVFTKSEEVVRLAPLTGFVIWLWIFGLFLEVCVVANKEPKIASTIIIFAQLSKTAFMTAAVVFFESVESILYAAMFQGLLQFLILVVYVNSRFPRFWKSFDLGFFKKTA